MGPLVTFDNTIRLGELLILGGVARQLVQGAMTLRDTVLEVKRLRAMADDHEQRIRALEWARPKRHTGHGG